MLPSPRHLSLTGPDPVDGASLMACFNAIDLKKKQGNIPFHETFWEGAYASFLIFFVVCEKSHIFAVKIRPDGGIGRRDGLKHRWGNPSRFEPGSGYTQVAVSFNQ